MNADIDVKVKRPVFSSIQKGKKYLAHVRLGGEFKMLGVIASSDPYKADYGKGRKAYYVDVFGYGWSGSVLASKLRVVELVKSMPLSPYGRCGGLNFTTP